MGAGPDGAEGRGGSAGPPWSRAISGPIRRVDDRQRGDRAGRHVEDVMLDPARGARGRPRSSAARRDERDAREDRLDPRAGQGPGTAPRDAPRTTTTGAVRARASAASRSRLGDGPQVVRGGAPVQAGGHHRQAGGVPLAVQDRGVAGADQVVADGQDRHADPAVADRVDAPLRRQQADHRQAEPGARRLASSVPERR